LEKPKSIVWCNNPVEMCRQSINWNHGLSYVWNQARSQIRGQVWSQINNQVLYQVWKKVSSQVLCQSYYQVIRDQVWNQVRNMVSDQESKRAWNRIWHQIWYGQQDIYWFAFFSYCMQVLRMESPKSTIPYMLLAQEVNWWFPTEQKVFVTRKPKECILKDGKVVKMVCQDDYILT
jgi:hypothetical protein